MTIDEMNRNAFEALQNLDFLRAQTLFRKSRKEYPGFISSQNLGAFYLHNGMDLSNGKTRSAVRDSIRLFQEALRYKMDAAISFSALGCAYMELALYAHEEYCEAESAYRKALSIEETWKRWYNLGAIRNHFGDFKEAAACFHKALLLCADADEETRDAIYMSYAFCVAQYDKKTACQLFRKVLLDSFTENNAMDLFKLAYYCDAYNLALEILRILLKTTRWALNLPELIMAMICCFKTHNEQNAKEYLDFWIEYKKQFDYYTAPEIRTAKKIYMDANYQMQFIHEYKEQFSIEKEDYYVG